MKFINSVQSHERSIEAAITKQVVKQCDHLIDLHGGMR